MSGHDTLNQFAKDVTSPLRDDIELQLDIRAEVLGHLEDKMKELQAAGKPQEECMDLVLRSFGSAEDVGADLLLANARRMKIRSLVRIAIRVALVPLAVIVALYFTTERLSLLRGMNDLDTVFNRVLEMDVPEDARFIIHGDRSRKTFAGQQRAIWESDPENLVYFGNYITQLLAGPSGRDIEKELRRGESMDPNNGRYNYLLACLYLEKACKVEEDRSRIVGYSEHGPVYGFRLDIKNRVLLDQAMKEVLKAEQKPLLNAHGQGMLKERLKKLPPSRRVEHQITKIGLSAGVLLPDLARYRKISRVAPAYMRLLEEEGRGEEAEAYAYAWLPLATKLNESAFTLIEVLVVSAIIETGKHNFASALQDIGKPELAESVREKADQLLQPMAVWRTKRQNSSDEDKILARSGNILVNLILPAIGGEPPSLDELKPGRHWEHVLLESSAASILMFLLLLLMLALTIVAIRWKLFGAAKHQVLLLLLDWRQTARIMGVGVVLPILLYYIYTRGSGLAGWEYSVRYMWPRFVTEMVLLLGTIATLVFWLTGTALRERCDSLGMDVPAQRSRTPVLAFFAVSGLLLILCMVWEGWWADTELGALTALAMALAIFVGVMISICRSLFGTRQYAAFYGTAARSLVPMCAAAILVVAVLTKPKLANEEARWLQANTTLILDPEKPGFTRAEADVVSQLKSAFRQAAAKN